MKRVAKCLSLQNPLSPGVAVILLLPKCWPTHSLCVFLGRGDSEALNILHYANGKVPLSFVPNCPDDLVSGNSVQMSLVRLSHQTVVSIGNVEGLEGQRGVGCVMAVVEGNVLNPDKQLAT